MNPDYYWALVPALAVVLLHLDTFSHDARRFTAFLWRVGRGRVWE
jgi:hypothetical protein